MTLLNYFFNNAIIVTILGITMSVIICITIYSKNKKNIAKTKTDKISKNAIECIKNKLIYSSKKESINLLKILLNQNYTIAPNHEYLVDKTQNNLHFPIFIDEEIKLSNVIPIIQKYIDKYNKIHIYTITHDANITDKLKALKMSETVDILSISNVCMSSKSDYLNIYNNLQSTQQPKQKLDFKAISKKIINPTKWKSYTFFGVTLIILSRYNKFKIYYMVFGIVFLILATICLCKKLTTNQPKDNL